MALSALSIRVSADPEDGDDMRGPLPEAAPVVRYEWQGRFGPMVVEVCGDQAFVNGRAVEPHPKRS